MKEKLTEFVIFVIKSYAISEKLNFLIEWCSQSKGHSQLFFKINFVKRCKYAGEIRVHENKFSIYYVISAALQILCPHVCTRNTVGSKIQLIMNYWLPNGNDIINIVYISQLRLMTSSERINLV